MKTLIKSLLVALSLGVAASATTTLDAKPIGRPTGVATYKTGIYTSANGKLNIALDKQVGGSVNVQLKTVSGEVLYNQYIGKNERTFRRRLDLNELTDGTYVVEITNGVETTRQTISISTKNPATPGRTIQTEAVATN